MTLSLSLPPRVRVLELPKIVLVGACIATVFGLMVPPVVAHNDLGVYDQSKSYYRFSPAEHSGEVKHCDEDYFGLAESTYCQSPSDPVHYSSLQGFAFQDSGNGDVSIHLNCRVDINQPTVAGTAKVVVEVDGYDPEDKCVVPFTTATNQNQDLPDVHWSKDVPTGVAVEVFVAVEVRDNTWCCQALDRTEFRLNWVKGYVNTPAADLKDPGDEDNYQEISDGASHWVINDPSGDSQLWVGGVQIPVVDGVPMAVGQLTVTRSGAGDLGIFGKKWTIDHVDDLPFSARIRPDGADRLADIDTYTPV